MKWKLFLGQSLRAFGETLIKINNSFIKNHYPFGRNWMFDLKRILNEHPQVIIDAGVNIGAVSVELNQWFPKATIYAFEPVRNTFSQLVNNTTNKTYIKCINEALGSKNEKVTITLNSEHTINSLKATFIGHNSIDNEEINVIRLDDYLNDQNINHVDILKIDVEGFEFEVLEGCGSLFENDIRCILLEVGYEREPTKVHFSDVDKIMERKGFQLCGIYDTRRSLLGKRRLWYSNNLYIKKDLLT